MSILDILSKAASNPAITHESYMALKAEAAKAKPRKFLKDRKRPKRAARKKAASPFRMPNIEHPETNPEVRIFMKWLGDNDAAAKGA